jgi:hypothetical protein
VHRAGHDSLRGRTSTASRWSQHAEIAVRQRFGARGLDDVLAVHEEPLLGDGPDAQAWVVRVRNGARLYEVTVRHRPPGRHPLRRADRAGRVRDRGNPAGVAMTAAAGFNVKV